MKKKALNDKGGAWDTIPLLLLALGGGESEPEK
jgi:hypothetical protein